MTVVVSIVEGDGEVAALPVLLRRLCDWLSPGQYVDIAPPIRVHRDRFLNREEEFRRMLLLASAKCGDDGWILILLDADDDCPVTLSTMISVKSRAVVHDRRISVVLANREFEAWFLASAAALKGRRGLQIDAVDVPADPDVIRGAKEWLSRRIPDGRYRERTDQPALCAVLDLAIARERSRSFRKLCSDWERFAFPVE